MIIEEAKSKVRTQYIEYDWWLEYCQDCMCLGHETEKCPVNKAAAEAKKKEAAKGAIANDKQKEVTILAARPQLVHYYVEDKGSTFATYMTFVYVFNSGIGRKDIWADLRLLHASMGDQQVVLGDFNTCTSFDERINGAPV
ncbi:hypothetical protein RND71_004583 [Anisodus tanguticus]|uniref:Uncharacterized protein n=1 Tax=Anisodus tanguticus TaxID=243964 RepID=A0AAE1SQI2_9SOLA|nr:hypothetical protein RND71_004583 [Anisodus tanguticus]